ncbi:MAG: serine aminopeptidase domain-containing protein, partial [Thermoguttaceae bacterium]
RLDPERKEDLSFWAFQPSDDSAKTEEGYPLLVFMHGAGERGSNPNLLKRYGPPKLCDNPEIAKTWKFFTVSPQCKENSAWSPLQILAFIDEVCAKYPIDKSRIYVTGVSLGGFGTWGVATIGAGKIAAVAPVCGSYGTDKAAAVTMPVWAFHGEVDPVVKIEGDQAMIDAVKKAGNEDVKFTVYPGVGHDCWNLAYDEKELYEWLLTKSVKK